MNNSPTEGEQVQTASVNEPTVNEQVQQPSAEQNQEAISHEQSQEAASQTTAGNTNSNDGNSQNDDDGLANFAKSQGFDPENLTDGERRALKIAHDNQKAYRNTANEKKVTDAASELNKPAANETEDQKFRREFTQWKYEQASEKFWNNGSSDRSLEPTMVEILNEKKEQYGAAYAKTLSEDLPTLYGLAQLKSGANPGSPVDTEAIRREERESIKKQQTASAGQPHATSQTPASPNKIDREWLETSYDPTNKEHQKLVDEAVANGDL